MRRNGLLTTVAVGLGLVGTIGGGVWAMEARYAKAADLSQHIEQHTKETKAFSVEILESRRMAIRREIFTMEEASRARLLSPEERSYLDELRQQYQQTSEKIQRYSNP